MPEINSSARRASVSQETMEPKDYFRKYVGADCREKVRRCSYEESAAAHIAEFIASRRTVAEAFEIEHRRIENGLHDGAQQYIVAASTKLSLVGLEAPNTDNGELMQLLAEMHDHLEDRLRVLWRTVHRIHPWMLRDRGLQVTVEEIAEGHGLYAVMHILYPLLELEESMFATAHFFCAEVPTNATKYAPNALTSVSLASGQTLNILITDRGPGGAKLGRGLRGMKEYLAVFDGAMTMHSPEGRPAWAIVRIPSMLNRWESGTGEMEGVEIESVEMKGAEKK